MNVKNVIGTFKSNKNIIGPIVKGPNVDKIGFWRVGQQKGLTMFGDYDKDGVKNIFDCQPRNPLRQETDWSKEYGIEGMDEGDAMTSKPKEEYIFRDLPKESQKVDMPEVAEEPEITTYSDEYTTTTPVSRTTDFSTNNVAGKEGYVSGMASTKEFETEIVPESKSYTSTPSGTSFLKKAGQWLGAEEKWRQYEEEKELEKEARREAIKSARKKLTEQKYLSPFEKEQLKALKKGLKKGQLYPGLSPAVRYQTGYADLGVAAPTGVSSRLMPQQLASKVNALTGIGGSYAGADKARSLIGGYSASEPQMQGPTRVPQPIDIPGVPDKYEGDYQLLPDGRYLNLRTGKVVTYPRGRYK
jgi:hypothetical protein